MFRHTYTGIRIIMIQIKKWERHWSRVMCTSKAP